MDHHFQAFGNSITVEKRIQCFDLHFLPPLSEKYEHATHSKRNTLALWPASSSLGRLLISSTLAKQFLPANHIHHQTMFLSGHDLLAAVCARDVGSIHQRLLRQA